MKQLLLFAALSLGLNTQAQDPAFSKTYKTSGCYGATLFAAEVTHDNGLITLTNVIDVPIDGIIRRTDSDGNAIWEKQYNGSLIPESLFLNDVVVTHDSSYVVSGLVVDETFGGHYPFCMKLDENGDTLWTKSFDLAGGSGSTLGYDYRQSSRIMETYDSSILVAWRREATPDRLDIAKMTPSGDIIWSNSMEVDSMFFVGDLVEADDQSIYVIGNMGDQSGSGYLVQFSESGTFNWAKKYDGVTFHEGLADSTGLVISWKNLNSNRMGVMKMDASGVNIKRFGQSYPNLPDGNCSMDRRDNGNYLLSIGGDDVSGGLLIELDDTLGVVGANAARMILRKVRSIPGYGAYVVGYGPMIGVKSDYCEIGVIRFDSFMNSDLICSWPETPNISNDPIIAGQATTFASTDSIIESYEPIVISPSTTLVNNGCVASLGAVAEIDGSWNETVSPNPSSGAFTIDWSEYREAEITVYNSIGQEVYQYIVKDSFIDLDLGEEVEGVYYYQLKDSNGSQSSGKLVVLE